MERFIQLNLHKDSERVEAENLPKPGEDHFVENEKKLKKIARAAAHKAAGEYSRRGSGLFSK